MKSILCFFSVLFLFTSLIGADEKSPLAVPPSNLSAYASLTQVEVLETQVKMKLKELEKSNSLEKEVRVSQLKAVKESVSGLIDKITIGESIRLEEVEAIRQLLNSQKKKVENKDVNISQKQNKSLQNVITDPSRINSSETYQVKQENGKVINIKFSEEVIQSFFLSQDRGNEIMKSKVLRAFSSINLNQSQRVHHGSFMQKAKEAQSLTEDVGEVRTEEFLSAVSSEKPQVVSFTVRTQSGVRQFRIGGFMNQNTLHVVHIQKEVVGAFTQIEKDCEQQGCYL